MAKLWSPTGAEDVIGYVRDRGVTLTYDPAAGTLQAGTLPGRQDRYQESRLTPAHRAPRRKEEKKTAGRPARAQACARVTISPAAKARSWGITVSERGDLNTQPRAISPDRGNSCGQDSGVMPVRVKQALRHRERRGCLICLRGLHASAYDQPSSHAIALSRAGCGLPTGRPRGLGVEIKSCQYGAASRHGCGR